MTLPPKPLTFTLLRELSDGEFHSGEALAQQLDVSRASVSNALRDVAQYGLSLYSVRGRGYRLLNPPQWLQAERVNALLGAHASELHLEVQDCAASSNTLLLQRAAQGAPSGSVLALEWQSSGRGRLGRSWHSALGNALTFSVLWRFESGLSALSGLSLAVGVALLRALRELGIQAVHLKWPNDVLSAHGKLAGILIEAQGDMLGPCAVVIGIGLNLRLPDSVTQQMDQAAAGLAQLCASLPERNALLAALLRALLEVMREFESGGFTGFQAEWESYHGWQNQSVQLLLPDGKTPHGVLCGVTGDGALRLATETGMQIFHAGDVSLRQAKHHVTD